MAEFIDWDVSNSDREILRQGKSPQQDMEDLGRAVIDTVVFFAVIALWVSLRLYNKRAEELKAAIVSSPRIASPKCVYTGECATLSMRRVSRAAGRTRRSTAT